MRRLTLLLALLAGCTALSTATEYGCEPQPQPPDAGPEEPTLKFSETSMDLTLFGLSSVAIDVRTAEDSTDCQMTVTDNPTTVTSATCVIDVPGGEPRSCTARNPVGNLFTCTVTFDEDSPLGPYTVSRVSAKNSAGVVAVANNADLVTGGWPTSITVQSDAPDTTPPVFLDFFLSPPNLEQAGGLADSMILASDASGISSYTVVLNGPNGEPASRTCRNYGTAQEGECSVLIPAVSGVWTLARATIKDGVGNATTMTAAQLAALPGGSITQITVGAQAPVSNVPVPPANTCPETISATCLCDGMEFSSGYCYADTGYSRFPTPAATVHVTPTGAGTQSGVDWTNAAPWPPTWTRNTRYYVSDGDYRTGSLLTLDTVAQASDGIEIRHATVADHGSEVGWSGIPNGGIMVTDRMLISTSLWKLDGNDFRGWQTDFPINPLNGSDDASVRVTGPNNTLRNMELDGDFIWSNPGVLMASGACSSVTATSTSDGLTMLFLDAHATADDGIEIDNTSDVRLGYSLVHDMKGCGTDPDPNCSPCFNGHSDGIEILSSDDVYLAGVFVYHVQSTSALFTDDQPTKGVANNNLRVHNSIFYTPDVGLPATLDETPNAEIVGNIFWSTSQSDGYGGLAIDGPTESPGIVVRNNIMTGLSFKHLNPPRTTSDYDETQHDIDFNFIARRDDSNFPAGEPSGVKSNVVAATDGATIDPLFANVPLSEDPADHNGASALISDFLFQATSPAIGIGTVIGPLYDIVGTTRPQGGTYDPGAYEYTTGAGGTGGVGGGGGGGAGGAPAACTQTPALTATDGWNTQTQETLATTTLTFQVYAQVTAGSDAIVWVGSDTTQTLSSKPILVRFDTDNNFDARDGGAYSADAVVPWVASKWHLIEVLADFVAETYTVNVTPCDGAQQTVITDAAFRTNATLGDGLDYWGVWASASATIQAATGDVWTPGACTPLTCGAAPRECGSPSDGCGGTLSCGTCGGGQTCYPEGTCCTLDTCGGLGATCGSPSDGCGGTLSCGTCDVGETCIAGTCQVGGPGAPPSPATTGSCSEDGRCGSDPLVFIDPSDSGCGDSGTCTSWDSCMNTPGATYEKFTSGRLCVAAPNVTLRDCYINGGGGYAVHVEPQATGLTIEDCEIVNSTGSAPAALLVYADNLTMTRAHVHDTGADGIKWLGDNGVFQDGIIEKIGGGRCGGSGHADMIQATGALNLTLTGSVIEGMNCHCAGPGYKASHILMESGSTGNFTGNWMMSGGVSSSWIRGGQLTDNFIGTYFDHGSFCSGDSQLVSGNKWFCDGSPVTSCTQAKPACAIPYPSPCPQPWVYER